MAYWMGSGSIHYQLNIFLISLITIFYVQSLCVEKLRIEEKPILQKFGINICITDHEMKSPIRTLSQTLLDLLKLIKFSSRKIFRDKYSQSNILEFSKDNSNKNLPASISKVSRNLPGLIDAD